MDALSSQDSIAVADDAGDAPGRDRLGDVEGSSERRSAAVTAGVGGAEVPSAPMASRSGGSILVSQATSSLSPALSSTPATHLLEGETPSGWGGSPEALDLSDAFGSGAGGVGAVASAVDATETDTAEVDVTGGEVGTAVGSMEGVGTEAVVPVIESGTESTTGASGNVSGHSPAATALASSPSRGSAGAQPRCEDDAKDVDVFSSPLLATGFAPSHSVSLAGDNRGSGDRLPSFFPSGSILPSGRFVGGNVEPLRAVDLAGSGTKPSGSRTQASVARRASSSGDLRALRGWRADGLGSLSTASASSTPEDGAMVGVRSISLRSPRRGTRYSPSSYEQLLFRLPSASRAAHGEDSAERGSQEEPVNRSLSSRGP